MKNEKIESYLKKKTANMFSDKFYTECSEELNRLLDEKTDGYVYFIKTTFKPYIKIGKSYELNNRLRSFKSSYGTVFVIGYVYCKDYDLLELQLHNRFAKNRVFGEWFNIDEVECKNVIKENNGFIINTISDWVDFNDGFHEIDLIKVSDSKYENIIKVNIELKKRYYNEELRKIFKGLEISDKRIAMELKSYAIKMGLVLKQGVNKTGRWKELA